MTTTTTLRAFAGHLVLLSVLFFSTNSLAQLRPNGTPGSPSRDLSSTLPELMRLASRTNQDLATLQQQGGRLHWVTFWRGEKAQKADMTSALRRNLQFAVPDLIRDAQNSGGSISTTFKLYKDLTVVCESLDSLLPPASRENKTEPLSNDLSDMNRLREELSSYIQQTAASMESKNSLASSTVRLPKKVIVDDNVPEKPSPRKRRSTNQ